MSDPMIAADRRKFRCVHCDGKILIPLDLPPTPGPCPHCSGVITSLVTETVPAFETPPAEVAPPPHQKIQTTQQPRTEEEIPKIELPHSEHVSEHHLPKTKLAPKEGKRRSGIFDFLYKESRPIARTAAVELKWTGEAASPELEIGRFMRHETPSTAATK